MIEINPQHLVGPAGLIIFDGSCGICSEFIAGNESFFSKHGFSIGALQQSWVLDTTKLDPDLLSQAIYIYRSESESYSGIDSIHYLTAQIFWARPLYFILKVPGVKYIASMLYRLLAKRRKQISKVCGLQSKALFRS